MIMKAVQGGMYGLDDTIQGFGEDMSIWLDFDKDIDECVSKRSMLYVEEARISLAAQNGNDKLLRSIAAKGELPIYVCVTRGLTRLRMLDD